MTGVTYPNRRVAWGRLALIAVLAISLLANAVVVGAVVRVRQLRVAVMGDADLRSLSYPPEIRVALRHELMAQSETLGPAVQAAMAARAGVVATGTKVPFDRAAVEDEMAQFRAAFDRVFDLTQGIVLGVMEEHAAQQ